MIITIRTRYTIETKWLLWPFWGRREKLPSYVSATPGTWWRWFKGNLKGDEIF